MALPKLQALNSTHPGVNGCNRVFLMRLGDRFDRSVRNEMPAGSFATMRKDRHHSVSFHGATRVQLQGIGPLVLKWVDPEDDRERKKP